MYQPRANPFFIEQNGLYDQSSFTNVFIKKEINQQEYMFTNDQELLLTSVYYPADTFSNNTSNASSPEMMAYHQSYLTSPTCASTFSSPVETNFYPEQQLIDNFIISSTHEHACEAIFNEEWSTTTFDSILPTCSSSSSITSCTSSSSSSPQNKKINEGRPYPCHLCKRAFARKHDLQRHIRVHTGDKPYVCPCCKKAFARTDALKRHLRMEDHCRGSQEVQAMKETGRRRFRNL